MAKPVIEVQSLSKRYRLGVVGATTLREDLSRIRRRWFSEASSAAPDEFWALRDVSFEIQPGEVVGVLGRNGAGKSTLLKILSRITEPTSGRARLRGRVASLLEVGTGFHDDLTGRENIYLNGAILGMKHLEVSSKFDEILAFAEVEKFIDTPVKHYSSGMRVRLAFAVAAHLDPEILIIDEVLAVGDAAFQKKCLGQISDISKHGRTVLFVSHNLAVVSTLCHRSIVLQGGKVAFNGATVDALELILRSPSENTAAVDLNGSKMEHHGPAIHARLDEIELRDGRYELTTSLRMGDKMILRLLINVLKPNEDFEIGFVVANLQNIAVHQFVSGWEGLNALTHTGRQWVEVEVPNLALYPGRYQIHTWIAIRGQYYDDAVHEALRFEVHEGRVNGHPTYFERFSKNTQVYAPSSWRVTRAN